MRKRDVVYRIDDKDGDIDEEDDLPIEGCEGVDEEEGTSDNDDDGVKGCWVTVTLKEEPIEEAVEGGVQAKSLGLEDFADHQYGKQKGEGELENLTKVD